MKKKILSFVLFITLAFSINSSVSGQECEGDWALYTRCHTETVTIWIITPLLIPVPINVDIEICQTECRPNIDL